MNSNFSLYCETIYSSREIHLIFLLTKKKKKKSDQTVCSYRIERALRTEVLDNISTSKQDLISEGLITAVDIHRRALKLVSNRWHRVTVSCTDRTREIFFSRWITGRQWGNRAFAISPLRSEIHRERKCPNPDALHYALTLAFSFLKDLRTYGVYVRINDLVVNNGLGD